ncbi:hypothetical protein WOLCODRAFT_138110 [Wolfiporia cocos MD-104 SS10]|uniref:CCR4-NOT transcription complex subunit 11 n=1 Tax=Wolfiporia cocos (strain MD-104) TaxID=742152 RepID=A0A2H3JN44_WOLCO|nr:hypothetical protein WOLCODRAFT_138110 [Wolfiporia cocos MD-104 SS10]
MLQTTSTYAPAFPSMKQSLADPVRAAVKRLLSEASSWPCSTAAHTFTHLVQQTSRFSVALDVLLPLLDTSIDPAERILVSYILYSLYSSHPLSLNPFRSALYATFAHERDVAAKVASDGSVSANEQLIWVLWKILKGDGNDIGPYSPATLARSLSHPRLRAIDLRLPDEESPAGELVQLDPYGDSVSNAVPQTQQVTAERDQELQIFTEAMTLLLDARHRVLTPAEQRMLLPLLPELCSPPVVTSIDLPSMITTNPILAQPLVAALLSYVKGHSLNMFLEVLIRRPPVQSSYDLIERLLGDTTAISNGSGTVAHLVRTQVLGLFIRQCIATLDKAEHDVAIGSAQYAQGVQNLCSFFHSLIQFSIVDPASDADSAEMTAFALRNARIEDANTLYRMLVMAKF